MDINRSKTNIPPRRAFSSIDGMSGGPFGRQSYDTSSGRRPADEPRRTIYAAPKTAAPAQQTASSAPLAAPKTPVVTQALVRQSDPQELHFPLPLYEAPERPKVVVRKKNVKKMLLRTGSLMAVGVLITGGLLAWRGYSNFNKVFQGTNTVAALASETVAPELLKGEGDGRVNILLLGVGGAGHDGADLTDTIIVLSVDPVNKSATMLSLPRDMWVKMPVSYYGEYQKINAAYSAGKYRYAGRIDSSLANRQAVEAGFRSIDQSVGDVLGVSINYHLLVDFKAFAQAVDTVNGVSLNVKENLYDPSMAWENDNNPLLAAAGPQTMDGKKALMYARSRHTSSDFARNERQRELLIALKQKVLTAGTLSSPTKVDALMQAFGSNVYSDLSTKAAMRLFGIMQNVSDTEIRSIGLTQAPNKLVTTDRVGDISVVRPVAGFNNYSDIHAYVKSQLRDGYLAKENASIVVYGGTAARAQDTATTLKGLGYNITGTFADPKLPEDVALINLGGMGTAYTRHYLEERFQTKAVSTLPSGMQVPAGTQFVILLK